MHSDPAADDMPPTPPAAIDAAALKGAHGRTGRMFKNAGLPFEADEFDGDDEDSEAADGATDEDSEAADGATDEDSAAADGATDDA